MLEPSISPVPEVTVVVDDREQNSKVIEALQAHPGVVLAFRRLPVGDYRVNDRCLIERKTVSDFARSIIDGRLFSQAKRLAGAMEATAMILEGKASDLVSVGLQREALQGAMVSLTIIFGIPVLRSLDAAETARLIVYASNQIHRHMTGLTSLHYTRPKKKQTLQLRLLQGLPGVGPDRARKLLDHFGSVQNVMAAEEGALRTVYGIGEKTAAGIRWALEEATARYLTPADGAPTD